MYKLLFLIILILTIIPACGTTNTSPTATQISTVTPPVMKIPDITNYLIVKYDRDGNQIWTQLYNEVNQDKAVMIFDNAANVYIINSSLITKFSNEGKLLYEKNIDTGGISRLRVIEANGNIYITGSTTKDGDEITIIQYNNLGELVWQRYYSYPGSKFTSASDIAVDKSGNIFVAGDFNNNGDDSNYFIIKYDEYGTFLWNVYYDGPQHKDYLKKMIVDNNDNVYITGRSLQSISSDLAYNFDYTTIKYDSNGNELWVARYDGQVNVVDDPADIVVDQYENVYVTGESNAEYATIKYDKEGQQQWAARYDGEFKKGSAAAKLVVADDSTVYVTGKSGNPESSGSSYATIKYNIDGQQLWVSRYKAVTKIPRRNEANHIFVDNDNNVYITGYCSINSQSGTFSTIKYSQTGNELWAVEYFKVSNIDKPAGLTVDPFGNVYLLGTVSRYNSEQ